MDIKAKRAEQMRLVNEMRAIDDKATTEKRKLTAEEETKWNALDADQENIGKEIMRFQKVAEFDKQMNATQEPKLGDINASGDRESNKEEQDQVARVFNKYIRLGLPNLEPAEQQLMNRRFITDDKGKVTIRAAQTVTTTGGGYLIPQGFSNKLEDAIKAFGGMLQAAEVFSTDTGNPFLWPTDNDTTVVGELLGINTTAALAAVTFGQVLFGAYKYSSKTVLVPIELLQDSFFDLNTFLAKKLGQRIGRIINQHFTTGTGTGQPGGVVTGATSGKVGLTGQTTSVIYDDLVDLVHAVDPGYRTDPSAQFMMADSSLKVIKKIKDTTGRPLWLPFDGAVLSPDVKNPPTIMGYPYTINQDMAVMAANAKSILFGAFSTYKIRRVMEMSMLRLAERYADVGQVGFLVFARYDGQLVDAGTHPIQYYANSAT